MPDLMYAVFAPTARSSPAPLSPRTPGIVGPYVLEHGIEGEVSREPLIGLLVHNAVMPGVLSTKALSGVARHSWASECR